MTVERSYLKNKKFAISSVAKRLLILVYNKCIY